MEEAQGLRRENKWSEALHAKEKQYKGMNAHRDVQTQSWGIRHPSCMQTIFYYLLLFVLWLLACVC